MKTMLKVVLEEKPYFCSALAKKISAYFKDEEHKKQFEKWYREKYGKEYEWRE